MRVLYVETKGAMLNGSQQSLLNLIQILERQGIEPYLACHMKWELVDAAKDAGIHTIVIPYKSLIIRRKDMSLLKYLKYPAKIVFNQIQARKASKFLTDNQIDIVHLNTTLAPEIWAKAAQICNIPYIWHIREFLDIDHDRILLNKKHIYHMIANATEVIAISQSVKSHWEKRLGVGCKLIYNGLPPDRYYERDPRKFENDKVGCLIIGRIDVSKGQMDAVKAVEQLIKIGRTNISLTIIGYRGLDEYEISLKEYIEAKKLSDHIKLVEYTYDMAQYRHENDIGLMCSRSEAFGRVTVEYMMSGMLVIGTNSGGTPELIEDGVDGFLYEYGDSNGLANLMIYALEHREEMKGVAERGQRKAMEKYTIERAANEVLNVYKSIEDGVNAQ